MAKLTITGNTRPTVGETEMYSLSLSDPFTLLNPVVFPLTKVEWNIHVQDRKGWRITNGNLKEGTLVTYKFTDKSLQYKALKIEVIRGKDKGDLYIKPRPAENPGITHVELLDIHSKRIPKGKLMHYTDTIIVKAYCVGMFGQKVAFTLWEDDATGKGHDPVVNMMNKINRIPLTGEVDHEGVARVVFRLPAYTLAVQIANAGVARGDKNEGKTHEYYVTAEVISKHILKASPNVNVANPGYIPPVSDQRKSKEISLSGNGSAQNNPKPKENTAKFPQTPAAKKQADPEGRILSAEFTDGTGKTLKNAGTGDIVSIKITSQNMKGKSVKVKIWEEDLSRYSNDLLYEIPVVLAYDTYNFINGIPLTRKMYAKGNEWGEGSSQEYFIEVEHLNTSVTSRVILINPDAEPVKVEDNDSVVIIKEKKQERIEKAKICECEARLRAFMRMIRIGEGTEDEAGYTRIVGGSSFKDHGKDMSTHPEVYIEKYDSTAAGAYQITKTNWNSEAFAKWRIDNNVSDFSKESQDIYCAYLIIKKKKAFENINSNDIDGAIDKCSKEWASLPGAGYGQREESREKIKTKYKAFLHQELSDSSNLHLKKGFLKRYFGIHCCDTILNTEQDKSDDIMIIFDKNIEVERQKIVSEKTKNILKKAARSSGNKKIIITSTIRSPRKQAEAMYNNESNGRHIKYASPGRQVLNVYNLMKNQGKERTINAMVEKINELSRQGKRVSLHCVAESEYAKLNILDVSYTNGLVNYQQFILDLAKDISVIKIIHPIVSVGTKGKINYDNGEPAIHIEIQQ
ncbi:hypothetical protein EGY05_11160 [Chryseobacterium arthrosphaerae]|uniref:glycoside hydrolase family 24 protein n=1 Tax=Chryseobacterium arthrosphaerae TaxID=651561 RepID=UPI000F516DB0|nr:glycoside hydrolase family 104 protein [Chryseobacterium arthrosphaerae]AYZ12447.1 hypothetical protein EGY05_11160 [Chryseobacterium arthrosphaerae]